MTIAPQRVSSCNTLKSIMYYVGTNEMIRSSASSSSHFRTRSYVLPGKALHDGRTDPVDTT